MAPVWPLEHGEFVQGSLEVSTGPPGGAGALGSAAWASIDEYGTVRLEITQRADLAVRALVVLDANSSRCKSADLADALSTTPGFVPQVMGPLVHAGWVRSVPGPTGGYELLVGLDDLSVLQVVEVIDGPTDTGRCVVADRTCQAMEPCVLHVAWSRARQELCSTLSSIPLSTVAAAR
jgi:Rrf2 family transcriptional regulator, iron-sulfur cluster assembly transcription factor